MRVSCPTCRHETSVDHEIGDFPTRCTYCSGLLRLPPPENDAGMLPTARSLRLEGPPARRTPRGELAGLLLSRPQPQLAVAGFAFPMAMMSSDSSSGEETLADAERSRLRSHAIRRAQLRGNQEALSALGWVGLGIVVVLAIIAIAMRAQTLLGTRATAHATYQTP